MSKFTKELLEYPATDDYEKYLYHMNRLRRMFETYAVDKVSTYILLRTLRKILTLYYLSGGDMQPEDRELLENVVARIQERLQSFVKVQGFDFVAKRCPWRKEGVCQLRRGICSYETCPVFESGGIFRYVEV